MKIYVYGLGGLGNTLYQLICGLQLAKDLNGELIVVESKHYLTGSDCTQRIHKKKRLKDTWIPYKTILQNIKYISEPEFDKIKDYLPIKKILFSKNDISKLTNDSDFILEGYCQNISIWNKDFSIFKDIINFGSLQQRYIQMCKKYNINGDDNIVLCLRRYTDGTKQFNNLNYYKKILNQIDNTKKIYVISDIPWNVKSLNPNKKYVIIQEQDILQLMFMIYSCSTIISSASTFHLWGAYLSNAGTIYCPNIKLIQKLILNTWKIS
jgi:hypothetical protein